jgi:hypothetical protein
MRAFIVNVVAVAAGLVIGGCVNMALVNTGPHIFPLPEGVNMADAKSLKETAHLLEPRHFIFPFIAHAVGTFVGALAAHLIAVNRRSFFAWVIGFVYLAGGIMATFMIPAPAWFLVLDLVVAYLPMAWLATKLGAKLRQPAPLAA